ncbi:TIGR01906 family membrane protein [Anaerotignum sp.]|uniref:TIGR01906 family membrane protein n=1 Tax=Anaerotignum sp. TaxID=2039241 RepID=UPI0028AE21AE|nr:TIGR01906 family membrane protein [Anaerotignum sp.]
MRFVYKGIGLFTGLALMFVLIISSTEYVIYCMDGYFEKEYKKYNVAKSINIEMNDLMIVTHEMMDYLKGDREDLVVYTKIDGGEREFFNAKEKRHMVDVQNLFIKAVQLRRLALLFSIFAMGILLFAKKGYHLFQGLQWGIATFFILIGVLVSLMIQDFNRYFITFHHVFFSNNDWILNPKTDLLINIVPEGFFRDTAFWISGIFLASAFVTWLLSWFLAKRMKTGE